MDVMKKDYPLHEYECTVKCKYCLKELKFISNYTRHFLSKKCINSVDRIIKEIDDDLLRNQLNNDKRYLLCNKKNFIIRKSREVLINNYIQNNKDNRDNTFETVSNKETKDINYMDICENDK